MTFSLASIGVIVVPILCVLSIVSAFAAGVASLMTARQTRRSADPTRRFVMIERA